MRISSVIINNYKSIGTQKNALLLEDDVTALIGKNDSGKSNVLEILGAISFSHYILEDFYKFNNSFLDGELSLVVELKFTNNEINLLKEYKNIQDDITYFYFSQYREIEFKGGFSRLFDEDIELVKSISYLKKELMLYLEENYYDSMDSEFFCEVVKYINSMENINNTIWIKYKKSLNKLLYILNSYGEDYLCISEDDNFNDNMQEENKSNMAYDENRYTLIRHLEIVKSKIRKKYSMLPILYHRKSEEELQNEYQLEEVKKQIKDRRGALYKFILASEINTQEFLLAMENDDENQLEICRNKIKEKIKYNIQKKFNEFYCEENVQIKISFKKDYIKILVKTNENTTNINERSNGLRWYLNLFIDILANDIKDTNVIYLLDEPGVYLHVNAQRELLRLFYDLCKNDNQVVYSTHSPYMIDSNNIINIRAIEKDEKGHTNIYNTAYDNKLNSVSKRETLSPLVQAIGADLRFNIGPQGGKLNIVTEGITDYIFFVNCNDTYNNKDKDIYKYAEFVETLISEEDKGKFSINYVDNKTMAAKEFYDKVKCKSVNLSDKTVNNFKKLFKIMNVI